MSVSPSSTLATKTSSPPLTPLSRQTKDPSDTSYSRWKDAERQVESICKAISNAISHFGLELSSVSSGIQFILNKDEAHVNKLEIIVERTTPELEDLSNSESSSNLSVLDRTSPLFSNWWTPESQRLISLQSTSPRGLETTEPLHDMHCYDLEQGISSQPSSYDGEFLDLEKQEVFTMHTVPDLFFPYRDQTELLYGSTDTSLQPTRLFF